MRPLVWGGDPACDHEWGDIGRAHHPGQVEQTKWKNAEAAGKGQNAGSGQWCRCGAWFGALGLEPTPDLYVAHLVLVFEEVRRVLKSDGVLWLNLGDCYATGAGKVGECPGGGEQGARWKGDLVGGHRGSRGGSSKQPHTGAAVGPLTQPNRLPIAGLKPKDLVGVPWMAAFALRAAGWYLRSDVIWSKPNPMPESVTDRPTKAHEYFFLLTKSERYYYDADAIREAYAESTMREISDGYDGEATKDYNSAGVQNPSEVKRRIIENYRKRVAAGEMRRESQGGRSRTTPVGRNCGLHESLVGRNKRTVWTVNTQPYPDAHFATFPEALIEPCILAGSRQGDLVLDPFVGTGTVGQTCERLMRRWVGTDLGYQQLAKQRTRQRGLRLDEARA